MSINLRDERCIVEFLGNGDQVPVGGQATKQEYNLHSQPNPLVLTSTCLHGIRAWQMGPYLLGSVIPTELPVHTLIPNLEGQQTSSGLSMFIDLADTIRCSASNKLPCISRSVMGAHKPSHNVKVQSLCDNFDHVHENVTWPFSVVFLRELC